MGLLLLATAIPFFTAPPSRAAVVSALHPNEPDPVHSAAAPITEDTRRAVSAAYGKLPLSFEANYGQTAPEVRFVLRGEASTLFLTRTGVVLRVQTPHQQSGNCANKQSSLMSTAVISMNMVNADPAVEIVGGDRLPGNSHYFRGNAAGKRQTNIPTFARVQYRHLYPGIDLVYYGNQRQLEYDFEVAPGGDPKVIKRAFAEVRKIGLSSDQK